MDWRNNISTIPENIISALARKMIVNDQKYFITLVCCWTGGGADSCDESVGVKDAVVQTQTSQFTAATSSSHSSSNYTSDQTDLAIMHIIF